MKFTNILVIFAICISFSNGFSFSYAYMKYFKLKAVDIIDQVTPKGDCSRHLKALVADLFNFKKLWAMKMIDASAKFQTGFLAGNIFHFGNYDECLDISEDKGRDGLIMGQYCILGLTPAQNTSSDIGQMLDFSKSIIEILGIREGKDIKHMLKLVKMLYGICLPKSCSAENIQKLWNHVEYTFRLPVHVTAQHDLCVHKGKVPLKFDEDSAVIWGFGLFFAFICLATLYDIAFSSVGDDSLWSSFLISFSVRRNAAKIFDLSPTTNEDSRFSCINGLKVISMLWVILAHEYALGIISGAFNLIGYFEWRKTASALSILVAPFSVDTFLVISGLLMAYKYMQIRDMLPPNTSFPYFMFYFLRLIRLWPGLIATVLAYTYIIKYLSDGPLWALFMYRMVMSCRYTGWPTAFFATNLVKFQYQCVEPSWYLAVDTQLYCVAPILLYLLYKYPRRATGAIVAISIFSAIYAYAITVTGFEKWTPLEGYNSYHSRIYQASLVRMPAWLFGLLAGTLLYNFQQIRLTKVAVATMWITVATIILGIFAVNHVMIRQPYNEYHAGYFNAAARPLWAIAICILIILCASKHGGFVQDILSLNVYRPLIKISYSMFLVHSSVLLINHGSKRSPIFQSDFTNLHRYIGNLPFIVALSFVWYLAFESPFINLAQLLVKKHQKNLSKELAIAPDDKKRLRKTMREHQESSKHRQSKSKKNE